MEIVITVTLKWDRKLVLPTPPPALVPTSTSNSATSIGTLGSIPSIEALSGSSSNSDRSNLKHSCNSQPSAIVQIGHQERFLVGKIENKDCLNNFNRKNLFRIFVV